MLSHSSAPEAVPEVAIPLPTIDEGANTRPLFSTTKLKASVDVSLKAISQQARRKCLYPSVLLGSLSFLSLISIVALHYLNEDTDPNSPYNRHETLRDRYMMEPLQSSGFHHCNDYYDLYSTYSSDGALYVPCSAAFFYKTDYAKNNAPEICATLATEICKLARERGHDWLSDLIFFIALVFAGLAGLSHKYSQKSSTITLDELELPETDQAQLAQVANQTALNPLLQKPQVSYSTFKSALEDKKLELDEMAKRRSAFFSGSHLKNQEERKAAIFHHYYNHPTGLEKWLTTWIFNSFEPNYGPSRDEAKEDKNSLESLSL